MYLLLDIVLLLHTIHILDHWYKRRRNYVDRPLLVHWSPPTQSLKRIQVILEEPPLDPKDQTMILPRDQTTILPRDQRDQMLILVPMQTLAPIRKLVDLFHRPPLGSGGWLCF